jgi:hypothetical protein
MYDVRCTMYDCAIIKFYQLSYWRTSYTSHRTSCCLFSLSKQNRNIHFEEHAFIFLLKKERYFRSIHFEVHSDLKCIHRFIETTIIKTHSCFYKTTGFYFKIAPSFTQTACTLYIAAKKLKTILRRIFDVFYFIGRSLYIYIIGTQ